METWVSTVIAAAPAVPPAGDTAGLRPGPTIWFDVEDVLRYFDKSPATSGIQRVCYEIFAEAERLFGASGRVRFCRVSGFTGYIEAIGFSAVREVYRDPPARHRPAHALAPLVGRQGMLSKLRHVARAARQQARWQLRIAKPRLRDYAGGFARHRRCAQEMARGDVIVSLGGPWTNRRYGRHIAAIKQATGVKFAILIHDIVALAEPTAMSSSAASAFVRWLKEIMARTDALFTVSDFTRRELVDYAARAGWTLPPVDVLRLGTGFRETPAAAVRPRSLPERFVLFVSTIEIRKNHGLLLGVWRRLLERHGRAAVPTLVFVGRLGWLVDDLLADLAASNFLDGKIVLSSDLSDAAVAEAYRRCLFTVYPSRYEGWGLPVAESLLHGKFAIVSDRASLPEVGGDFVDYVDPTDEDDVLAKLERVLFEPGYLASREARLRTEYRPPSWADCARRLIDAIDDRLPRSAAAADDAATG